MAEVEKQISREINKNIYEGRRYADRFRKVISGIVEKIGSLTDESGYMWTYDGIEKRFGWVRTRDPRNGARPGKVSKFKAWLREFN